MREVSRLPFFFIMRKDKNYILYNNKYRFYMMYLDGRYLDLYAMIRITDLKEVYKTYLYEKFNKQ